VWGIAAIVAFVLSLVLWLWQAQINAGHVLTWPTFLLVGLLCLAVHTVAPGWPRRGTA
jgi:hypothetical protein